MVSVTGVRLELVEQYVLRLPWSPDVSAVGAGMYSVVAANRHYRLVYVSFVGKAVRTQGTNGTKASRRWSRSLGIYRFK